MNPELIESIACFKANKERLLGRLLNRSYRFMSDLATEYLSERGYTYFRVGHVIALVQVELAGSNVNTMAQKAGISKQAMSKLVKELQQEGMVTTQKDKLDARAIVVKLTDKGLQGLLDWKACVEYIDGVFTNILGTEQLEKLKDILVVLSHHYEQNFMAGPPFDSNMMNKRLGKKV